MADNKFSRSQSLMASCVPMTTLQSILGGKWKILIVWYIAVYKVQRFEIGRASCRERVSSPV